MGIESKHYKFRVLLLTATQGVSLEKMVPCTDERAITPEGAELNKVVKGLDSFFLYKHLMRFNNMQ